VVVLVRLGEVTVKAKATRRRFERLLLRNMRDALSSEGLGGFRIEREWGRIFVHAEDEARAAEVLTRVFGVKSVSVCREERYEGLEDLVAKASEYFADKVGGRRFAVRARRAGEDRFTSMDVERELGSRLREYGVVDLENPEVTAYVEARAGRAYLYTSVVRGYGGLPVGCEGRVLALVSGGFDSPVAAWFMLRRGAEVHYLLCRLGGYVQEASAIHVLKVLAARWSYGYSPKLYVADFSRILSEIRSRCDPSLTTVLLKRFMYRVGEALAQREGFEGLVTGEVLGQAASQTLRNLLVTSKSVSIPVYRPLIGFDKDDVVELARRIGTYEASSRVKEYCGAFVEHPATHADPGRVAEEEAKLSGGLVEEAVSSLKTYDLRSVHLEEESADLEVERVPEGAVVIDLRPPSRYSRWHVPGSINIGFDAIVDGLGEAGLFDRSRTYVLVCDEGALSLEAAYLLRRLGYSAYSLRGGIRRIRKRIGSPSG